MQEGNISCRFVERMSTCLALQHNVLFVGDEIQTGIARTGRLLACDHDGVRPDIVILGKVLAHCTFCFECQWNGDDVTRVAAGAEWRCLPCERSPLRLAHHEGESKSRALFRPRTLLTTKHDCQCITAGTHGSTFGGNPVGCAAAIAALQVSVPAPIVPF